MGYYTYYKSEIVSGDDLTTDYEKERKLWFESCQDYY